MRSEYARAMVLAVLAAGGCYADKAKPGGVMGGTGMSLPDGGEPDAPGIATPADAAAIDGAPAATDGPARDVTPSGADAPDTALAEDAPPSDAAAVGDGPTTAERGPDRPLTKVEAYRHLLDQQWAIWSQRWLACSNTVLAAIPRENAPVADNILADHELGLTLGLLVIDEAQATACLEALRTLSCEGLATRAYEATCGRVLAGQVATGGFCVSPQDCRNAPADDCQVSAQSGCLSRCTARVTAPEGAPCDQVACAANAACYVAPGQAQPPRCHLLHPEGTSCIAEYTCVPGAWCEPTSADTSQGACRKVAAGGACAGSWQCPFPYVCRFATPGATAGSCGPGRALGEACALHGVQSQTGPFSDCAAGLHCYPDAAGTSRCGLGRELGQSCDDVDTGGPNPLSVPCRVGSCRLMAGVPTCLLDGKVGDRCDDDLPCDAGLVCDLERCRDPLVGVGETCDADGNQLCPPGARCALTAGSTTDFKCVVLKKVGEACAHPDDCVAGAECAGAVCTTCK